MTVSDQLNILLLEDHGMVRAGFKALLKEFSPEAQVHEAANYQQAIAVLDGEAIDFAFLDFKLEGDLDKSGLDVLLYIRENALPIRAIMLSGGDSGSGYLAKASVMQCLAAGACGYIPKAMEGDGVLREALETVLQGRVFLPAFVYDRQAEGDISCRNRLSRWDLREKWWRCCITPAKAM